MSRGSTLFLKFVIFGVAIGALAICIYALPAMAAMDAAAHPELAYQQYPFLAYAYTLCALFLVASFQGYRILDYIDANKGFSEQSVRALKIIKYCAFGFGGLLVAGIVALMILAAGKGEDITGIVMPAIVLTLVAAVGAAVIVVIQKHVQKGIELKSENDLTV